MVDKLSDFLDSRIALSCALCGRYGEYSGQSLFDTFGGGPMERIVQQVAAARGCRRAEQALNTADPSAVCRIKFSVVKLEARAVPGMVGTARDEGWQLTIACAAHHAGLKSMKPCRGHWAIDLETLAVALGPRAATYGLEVKLHCPGCGRRPVTLYLSLPTGTGQMRRAG